MIRPYTETDFCDVAYLNKTSYSQPCTDSVLREKLTHGCWVATMPGAIPDTDFVLGAAITCPEEDKTLLWSITVAPAQQNKGWGSALIREVSKHFRELWLYVDVGSVARRLYEREGFKVERLMADYYGVGQHALLMKKVCL